MILPIPDLMIAGRVCPEMSHYAEALYRKFVIDVVGVDLITSYQESDYPFLERYLEQQFKEILIPKMEKVYGKPFNYDRMSEILTLLKKTATIRNECLEKVPSPWTLLDYGVSLAPVTTYVKAIYSGGMLGNNMAKPGLSLVSEIVPEYHIDGLIFFTAKNCRIWKRQLTIMEKMERKYGIPGVTLEADMADAKMFSEAQIDTRLEAFFEVLAARKEKRRWV
ncbi:MAG: 2-hydroxyacyl-CoA dehydratase family protein [Thermodesulfobacteriota bacterium]|nr:2-hydroxyacyl-CoA dehydratase family protein [Thermodesulfobacteriota bacterium]